MTERNPDQYKNRHSKGIRLDDYHGIARDIMKLNAPVADKFMSTADMRRNVVINQKPQDRVRNYDQIGHVIIAKNLKIPRIDFWKGNGITETKGGDDEVWYISIDDQELAHRVSRVKNPDAKKFDDKFVDAFTAEVNKGLKHCLRKEKLLNSGNYDLRFGFAYIGALNNLAVSSHHLVSQIAIGDNPIETLIKSTASTALLNIISNIISLILLTNDKCLTQSEFVKNVYHNLNSPFVKHSAPEFIMPPVPLDRLIRGIIYLNMHGDRIITRGAR